MKILDAKFIKPRREVRTEARKVRNVDRAEQSPEKVVDAKFKRVKRPTRDDCYFTKGSKHLPKRKNYFGSAVMKNPRK